MDSLVKSLDRLHSTPMGLERIRHNRSLQTDDIILWCQEAINNADRITRQGKKWFFQR